ncbi:MAG: GNAT family N-acetyltransferase, partial [Acetobacteraceae bacterium]
IDGVLAGTVTLHLATPQNQAHRADVAKLLVDPAFRRHGLAARLMARMEDAARAAGRSLLTLDTQTGDAGEALYRHLGWQEAGRIPGYARHASGSLIDTVLFWKTL